MNKKILITIFLLAVIRADPLGPLSALQGRLKESYKSDNVEETGLPLILDPINEDPAKLRDMAQVTGLNTTIVSYAGFLKVNETFNKH